MCRPKHVEQLRNIGIINSATRLHLVASFYEIIKNHVSFYIECMKDSRIQDAGNNTYVRIRLNLTTSYVKTFLSFLYAYQPFLSQRKDGDFIALV